MAAYAAARRRHPKKGKGQMPLPPSTGAATISHRAAGAGDSTGLACAVLRRSSHRVHVRTERDAVGSALADVRGPCPRPPVVLDRHPPYGLVGNERPEP